MYTYIYIHIHTYIYIHIHIYIYTYYIFIMCIFSVTGGNQAGDIPSIKLTCMPYG